ncbi:MAG: helix-turn-helix domain-containing protein [Candidatus Omnitrophota bacterium]|jgi:cytoskeletal protein RodZ
MNIETAGARLKKIRQERGLSLEDIQKKTKIHLNVLRAIEGDSISDLSPIYLKGFIKIYCNCLGLDLKEYLGETSQSRKPVLNAAVGRDIGERIEKKPALAKDFSVKLGAIRPPAGFKKIIVFVVIAVIFIFLAVKLVKAISFWHKKASAKARIFIPASKTKLTRELLPKETINKSSKRNIPKQAKAQKELSQGFMLGIFARDKSWVSAKVDGKVVFHGVLARGRSETWQAKEKIELSLGDAGAVELQVNDQRFTKLGRRGQSLKNIVINKEGLKIAR